MKTRAITGFFFVIVMLASVLLGANVFAAFYLILSLFCLYEFYGLAKKSGSAQPNIANGLFIGGLIYTLIAVNNYDLPAVYTKLLIPASILAMCTVFISELFKRSEKPFTDMAFTFMGIIYAVLPFIFFRSLAYVSGAFNFHLPLAFLIMLWANDTGAYLTGRFFGRTKLFERHSPKKTWEGFIGGILISAVAAFILSRFYTELPWKQWVSMAILIGGFGTLGDLVESMFKRSINIKDSGGILPGHGGLLDRFDGLLLSAPIVYIYLYLITNL